MQKRVEETTESNSDPYDSSSNSRYNTRTNVVNIVEEEDIEDRT
jgi:hypothetical protein